MTSAHFGADFLNKYGRGKIPAERTDELKAELRQALRANVGSVEVPAALLENELSRFLEFGYASENNLDRLRRRVLRQPEHGDRASDVGSMAYSAACSQPRVGKTGADTPVPKLHPISEKLMVSPRITSARQRPTTSDMLDPPGSARGSISSPGGPNSGCKWSTVAKLNALREVEEADEKKAAIKRKQLELKSFLDEQVQAKTALDSQKIEETRRLRNQADDDFQKLQAEQKQKKDNFSKQVNVLKQDRQEQVLTSRFQREQDRQEALDAGKHLAMQAVQGLEAEQKAALDKKQREKHAMKKLIDDWNEEKKEHTEKQKMQHAAERMAVLKLQEELEEEERQKQIELMKALDKRNDEFQELARHANESKHEKKLKREARIREENRQLEHVRQANAQAEERERQKKMNQRSERIKNVEFLFQQMGERQKTQMDEVEQKKDLLQNARSNLAKFTEEERQKFGDKRNRNVQHRLELEEQITARVQAPARVREDLMSTSEAFINKRLVDEAGKSGLC